VTGPDRPATGEQGALDGRNAEFWDELCGSGLARELGIVDRTTESLRRYDEAYFAMYPYLKGYFDPLGLAGRRVLEIGLGYGTLGQYLAEQGALYHGIDIAPGPVEMMRYRLGALDGDDVERRVVVGSAHEIPFPDKTFDAVVSIGCLHHTGDIGRGVDEIHRVLVPGGTAVVMLYNRRSLRQFRMVDLPRIRARLRRSSFDADFTRQLYDANAEGEGAPHTDFVTKDDVRRLFGQFGDVRVRAENFDGVARSFVRVSRERLLRTPLPRLVGLDLYVTARK
jgi:SAM-dependent methyltransferase